MVGLINGQDLSAFLVGQSEKPLDMVELVHVFPLVKENLAVTVVDDSFLHDRGTDNVIHFLGDHPVSYTHLDVYKRQLPD